MHMSTDNIFAVILALFGLAGSFMAWFVKTLIDRIKKNEDACGDMGKELVALKAHQEGTAKAIEDLRKAMDDWQRDLRAQIGNVHDRVNELLKK